MARRCASACSGTGFWRQKRTTTEGIPHTFIRGVDGRRSIVVYHHLGRQKHEQQIKRRLGELRERLDTPQGAFALRYRRGTARAYFVLPAPKNAELLRTRAEALLGSSWGKNEHFDQVVYE